MIDIIQTDDLGSWKATADTVAKMTQITLDSADKLSSIVADEGLDSVDKIFTWVRGKLSFSEDVSILSQLGFNDVKDKELLLTPEFLLSLRIGDCDDFSTLIATLILAAKLPVAVYFVTIGDQSDKFSHVYVVIYDVEGNRLALDGSHGQWLGWEYPFPSKMQEWLVKDNRNMYMVSDEGMGAVDWNQILTSSVATAQQILLNQFPAPPTYSSTPGGHVEYRLPTGSPPQSLPGIPGMSEQAWGTILLFGGGLLALAVVGNMLKR